MKHPVVVGLQYGDEGKGKITDSLAKQAEWVIRFNGGSNAGHTLWLNGQKLVTHSVPSGVLYSHVKNFIGAGCVIHPLALKKELEELAGAGAKLGSDRLLIDSRAHLTLPIHLALDGAREAGASGIGTTKKGIGPTYTSKTDRSGIRVAQLDAPDLEERIRFLLEVFNPILKAAGQTESTLKENLEVIRVAQQLIGPHVSREATPFYDIAKKSRCVLEGAQGILLDIDHGTYPYVTSSNTIPAFASIGTPFPSSRIGRILGVAKAYLTRVGQGPMPTELHDETGQRIREKGHEFGATTGRPRRTGWLDLDELRLSVRLSDCSGIVLTKSDILSGEAKVAARIDGKLVEFEGWSSVTEGEALHPKMETFVQAIEKHVGIPVVALGTGADRAAMFWRRPIDDFWSDDVST